MINSISKYIKDEYYYICPKCGASFQPIANIAYRGECDNCGWEGVYRDLKYKSAKELVEEELNKLK